MHNLIYPLIESAWGKEILYSLRSLEKFLQEDYRVYVCGDWFPGWMHGVERVFFSRAQGLSTEENLGRILKWACTEFENFFWWNDDIYLLKPSVAEDLKPSNPLCDMERVEHRGHRPWQQKLWRTYDVLKSNGISHVYNYETHTPYFYEADTMMRIATQYPVFTGEVLHATVYYNYTDIVNNRDNNIVNSVVKELISDKAGFYSGQSAGRITIPGHMRFLNHDDNGLSDSLKKEIEGRFNTKSRFER